MKSIWRPKKTKKNHHYIVTGKELQCKFKEGKKYINFQILFLVAFVFHTYGYGLHTTQVIGHQKKTKKKNCSCSMISPRAWLWTGLMCGFTVAPPWSPHRYNRTSLFSSFSPRAFSSPLCCFSPGPGLFLIINLWLKV